jgi:hypothetical protein
VAAQGVPACRLRGRIGHVAGKSASPAANRLKFTSCRAAISCISNRRASSTHWRSAGWTSGFRDACEAAQEVKGRADWTRLSPQTTAKRLVSFLVSFMYVYLRPPASNNGLELGLYTDMVSPGLSSLILKSGRSAVRPRP